MMPMQRFKRLLSEVDELLHFEFYRILHPFMDPITAAFNFASTAAGQLIIMKLLTITEDIVMIIGDFLKTIHSQKATVKLLSPPDSTTSPAAR